MTTTMKPAISTEALNDIAEAEFLRLTNEAQAALNALDRFWTKLYGPNEALTEAHAALLAMDATFFDNGDDDA